MVEPAVVRGPASASARPGVPTLLGVPYDASSSYRRGAAEAPPRIREALRCDASNLWSETGIDLGAAGALEDAGDVALPPGGGARTAIEQAVAAIVGRDARPLVLGGDHAVTYPVLRAVRAAHPRLAVLHFDAHPDLYDEFQGDRYSHACPFARVMEEGLADRLVQVGVRTTTGHQRAQAERFGVEMVEMRAWRDDRPLVFDAPLYISLDVDVLDPAFAPGVSHREPGGLTVRQLLAALQRIEAPVIVGADLVELNPRQDVGGVTETVCAKLVKELAAAMLASRPSES